MNEKKRILKLVEKGILSTEEALVLLEKLNEESIAPKVNSSLDLQTEYPDVSNEEPNVDLEEVGLEANRIEKDVETSDLEIYGQMESADFLDEPNVEHDEMLSADLFDENQKEQINDKDSSAQDTTRETLENVGEQFVNMFQKTVDVVSDTLKHVEWQDISLKVPKINAQTVTHEFIYTDTTATILDINIGSGKVHFKTWDMNDIKIETVATFYGRVEEVELLDAFLKRVDVQETQDKLSFAVNAKRVQCDVVIYLPSRTYDNISIKVLNGLIDVSNVNVGDMAIKVTNGEISILNSQVELLEIQGVNTQANIKDNKISEFNFETLNGEILVQSSLQYCRMSLINGNVEVSNPDCEIQKIDISNINGDIHLSLPADSGFSGNAETRMGQLKYDLTDLDFVKENNNGKSIELYKAHSSIAHFNLKTKTGSVFLKEL